MRRITAILLAVIVMLSLIPAAFADGEETEKTVVDEEEIERRILKYCEEHGYKADRISVGYGYTATGETYYLHDGEWYYSASLYKVPLCMIYADRVHRGELEWTSRVGGTTLEYAMYAALEYSSNDYAHILLHALGREQDCREMFKQFATLSDAEYDETFLVKSRFSVRFMTEVMMTLFNEQERFPRVIDYLKKAQPGQYFRISEGENFEIAQKYGSYEGWHHCAAIIFTPNPIVVTVMTKDVVGYQDVIDGIGNILTEYTLEVEARHEAERIAAEEAAEKAEAERIAAEEQAAREEEARLRAEAEQKRLAEEAAEAARQEQLRQEEARQQAARERTVVIAAAAGGVLVIAAAAAISAGKRKRAKSGKHTEG